jgi:hypothetical protein
LNSESAATTLSSTLGAAASDTSSSTSTSAFLRSQLLARGVPGASLRPSPAAAAPWQTAPSAYFEPSASSPATRLGASGSLASLRAAAATRGPAGGVAWSAMGGEPVAPASTVK